MATLANARMVRPPTTLPAIRPAWSLFCMGTWLDVEAGFIGFVRVGAGGPGEDAGSAVVEAKLLAVVDSHATCHVRKMSMEIVRW
jgi:hypothetical protein